MSFKPILLYTPCHDAGGEPATKYVTFDEFCACFNANTVPGPSVIDEHGWDERERKLLALGWDKWSVRTAHWIPINRTKKQLDVLYAAAFKRWSEHVSAKEVRS
jgi:hypothetical protein